MEARAKRLMHAYLIVPLLAAMSALGAQDAALPASDQGGLRMTTALDLSFEYMYRSADRLVEPYAYKNGIDYRRDWLDRPALGVFRWDLGGQDGLSLGFTFTAKAEFNPAFSGGYFAPTNSIPLGRHVSPFAAEQDFVTRGVLAWKSEHLELSIGRDKVGYGDDVRGSIMPSSSLPYLDAFKSKVKLGPATLDWMVASLEGKRSWEGDAKPLLDVDPNSGVSGYNPATGTGAIFGFEDSNTPTAIYDMYHRISWDFGSLRLGLAENYIIARPGNRILVTDLLPLSTWHNANEIPNNSNIYIDATWKPATNFSIAFQAGFDDINANLFGVGDKGNTIPAAVLGMNWASDTGAGALELYSELGYTHYLWGNFSALYQGDIKYDDTLARSIYRLDMDNGAGTFPLTSPYGPGALWFLLSAGLELGDSGLRLGSEVLVLGKNTGANLVQTPYDGSARADPWALFASVKLPVRYRTGSFDISVAPDVCLRNRSLWLEASFALAYHLRGSNDINSKP
jgi:hypothetical protein